MKKIFVCVLFIALICVLFAFVGCSDAGIKWYSGENEPNVEQGVVGDFYFDTISKLVWVKTNDGWIIVNNGNDGINGEDGSTWLTGEQIVGLGDVTISIDNSKVGDIYFNVITKDVYKCVELGKWRWIVNLTADNLIDETSQNELYIGYDGHIWQGKDRTANKIENFTIGEYLSENTLPLYKNEYFETDSINLANNAIVLMNDYQKYSVKTGYSGLNIYQIKIALSTGGSLTVGRAKINTLNTQNVQCVEQIKFNDLSAGINTLTFNNLLKVEDDETIVIGGSSDSASLVVVKGVDAQDLQGCYAIDGEIVKTNGVNNKLAISVEFLNFEDICINGADKYTSLSFGTKNTNLTSASAYGHRVNYYENKTINKISIPITSVSALDENQTFTIKVIKECEGGERVEYVSKHRFTIPLSELGSTTSTKKWMTIKDVNVSVGSGETIMFGDPSDTVKWCYWDTGIDGYFINSISTDNVFNVSTNEVINIFIPLYTTERIKYLDHLSRLKEKEKELNEDANMVSAELYEILKNKNVSVLGDSISCFEGYSNDYVNGNSNTRYNQVGYGSNSDAYATCDVKNVEQTWWMKVIQKTGMKLLVNNASGGTRVTADHPTISQVTAAHRDERCASLHDNTGDNAGTKPDIIFVYMGINDFRGSYTIGRFENVDFDTLITDNKDGTYTYKTPTGTKNAYDNFAEAYAVTLHKITTAYKDSEIFIFNLPKLDSGTSERHNVMNDVISKLAQKYGCNLVDLCSSELSGANYASHTFDGLHPMESGMNIMAKTMIKALNQRYLD